MSILNLQNRCGVGIVQGILYPYKFQCVKIQAHQVSTVVCHKCITFVNSRAVLHTDPEGFCTGSCSVIAPFHDLTRIDGQRACLLIIAGIQLDEIQDPIFSRIDQSVCLFIDQCGTVEET